MNLWKQALHKDAVTLLMICCITGCELNKANNTYTPVQGSAGMPRFNLQYTNGMDNDVDLYVKTPDGSVICYSKPKAQNGKMDIDCLCGVCPNGANENIYWVAGTAPRGTYTVWANYFDPCLGTNGSANYIIRIMNGNASLKVYRGTVSTKNRKSPAYSFVY